MNWLSRYRGRAVLACAVLSLVCAVAGGWHLLRFLDGMSGRTAAAVKVLPLQASQPLDLPRSGRYLVSIRCSPRTPLGNDPAYRLTSRLSGYEVNVEPVRHRDLRLPGVIAYSHSAHFTVPQSGVFTLSVGPLESGRDYSGCEVVVDQPSLQIRAIVEDTILFTGAFLLAIALAVAAALIQARARA